MASDPYLVSTVSEVLGLYRPGAVPIVRPSSDVAADVVAAHESGHRWLCTMTSMGHLSQALALAANFAEDPAAKEAMSSALSEVIGSCLAVQEGYATTCQMLHLVKNRSVLSMGELFLHEMSTRMFRSLPEFYRASADPFLRAAVCAADDWPEDGAMQFHAAHINECIASTLADAAMGVPLSGFIHDGASCDVPGILAHVQRNAPDERLAKLVSLLPPEWYAQLGEKIEALLAQTMQQGTGRAIDDGVVAHAREMCRYAGLAYESHESVGLARWAQALKLNVNLKWRDPRDVPIEESWLSDRRIRLVAPEPFDAPVVDLRYLESLFPTFLEIAGRPLVVCELGWLDPSSSRNYANLVVHVFCRYADAPIEKRSDGDAEAPVRITSVCTTISTCGDAIVLRQRFPGVVWHWLVAKMLVKPTSWDSATLRQHGTIHHAAFLDQHNEPHGSLLRARSSSDDRRRIYCLDDYRWEISRFPRDAGIFMSRAAGQTDDSELEVVLAPLPPQMDWSSSIALASFELSCVADVLYCGLYSALLARREGLA